MTVQLKLIVKRLAEVLSIEYCVALEEQESSPHTPPPTVGQQVK